MKIIKRLGQVILVIIVLLAAVYPFRRDPIGPLAGKQVTGDRVPFSPDDWSFTNEHFTVALEVRPDDPHSITTICFVHEGKLYIPAQGGTEKQWTQIVLLDPRVHVKVGGRVYPGLARRVTDEAMQASLIESAAKKYDRLAGRDEPPPDVWVFRIDPAT